MKTTRQPLTRLASIVLVASTLSACGGGDNDPTPNPQANNGPPNLDGSIAATINATAGGRGAAAPTNTLILTWRRMPSLS